MSIKSILYTLILLFYSSALIAVEGACGVYILGCQGPLAGFVPPPGFYVRHDDFFYHGHAQKATFGGIVSASVNAHYFLDFTTLTLVTPVKFLGANYATSLVMPAGKLSINASLTFNPANPLLPDLALSGKRTDGGYADTLFYPAILGWHFGDLHIATSLGIFLPSGPYARLAIANLGRNHYAFDPGIGITWLDSTNGLEISSWTGCTFNCENKRTDYHNGDEFHSEFFLGATLAKKLKVGMVGYMYRQLTGDSGKGAFLGPFKGRVIGMGPLLLWNLEVAHIPISINIRYYKEFHTKNRFRGEGIFATFSFPLFSIPRS